MPVSRDKPALFAFENFPKRVFLDTNVINVLVKHSDQVFGGCAFLDQIDSTRASDIDALRKMFFAGSRANWDILGSQKTIEEIMRATDRDLRDRLTASSWSFFAVLQVTSKITRAKLEDLQGVPIVGRGE